MNRERINGHIVMYKMLLPDEDAVILFSDEMKPEGLHFDNHNIFRLNKYGDVVWQVKRDEQWRPSLEEKNRKALLEGGELERDPFGNFSLIYPDGTNNLNPKTGTPPNEAKWILGCTVSVSSLSGKAYELDIEAGIARNITPRGQRLW